MQLPGHFKVRNGEQKWVLKQMLERYVPRAQFDRPKTGFGIPIGKWLRGPLREWAEDLLSEDSLRQHGLFSYAPIRKKWNEHLASKRDWHYQLWDVLLLQSWLNGNAS